MNLLRCIKVSISFAFILIFSTPCFALDNICESIISQCLASPVQKSSFPSFKVINLNARVTNRVFPTTKLIYESYHTEILNCTTEQVETFFRLAHNNLSFEDLIKADRFEGYSYIEGDIQVGDEVWNYSIDTMGLWGRWSPKLNTDPKEMHFFICD